MLTYKATICIVSWGLETGDREALDRAPKHLASAFAAQRSTSAPCMALPGAELEHPSNEGASPSLGGQERRWTLMLLIIATAAALWTILAMLVVGCCVSAAHGDREGWTSRSRRVAGRTAGAGAPRSEAGGRSRADAGAACLTAARIR